MAGSWFAGLGQTVLGGLGTGITFGQVDAINQWTADGAKKVADSTAATWGEDGEMTKVVESAPVLGYVASAGHAIAGDENRARRACASATNSTLVTAGAVGGGIVGGPAGAIAGAAVASAAGQCSEMGINHSIPKKLRTDMGTFNEFDGGRFAGNMALDGAMGGVGAGAGKVAPTASRAVVGQSLKQVGGGGAKRYVQKRAVEQVIKQGTQATAKQILPKK